VTTVCSKDGDFYRYGFNGKLKDNEWAGIGNSYDYGFRMEDTRVARFRSVDPLTKKYPWYTPFQFAGDNPIKYIDLDGLEPANNPKDPANQDNRNPTTTVNAIYDQSGGDKDYAANSQAYMQGTSNPNEKITGASNKSGYTSDSKNADKYNLWVNSSGAFDANDYKNYSDRGLVNVLLGNFIKGKGPENIVFPTNGVVSNQLRGAGIVEDAVNSFYSTNKGRKTLVGTNGEYSGNMYSFHSVLKNGEFSLETFIGSASISVRPISNSELMVKIVNVTSIASGDLAKHLPWNKYPMSVVRDPSNPRGNKYGNISQTFSFTIPVDRSRLNGK